MPLEFVTWNVEHGSAAYIRTPNEYNIATDMGARRGETEFSPLNYLKSRGVSRLDLAVITHPHLDHIEDILNVDGLDVAQLACPYHLKKSDILDGNKEISDETRQIVGKYIDLSRSIKRAPSTHQIDGVSFRHFSPHSSSPANLNNHSVVTVMSYAGVKFLLPGDNESASWDELLRRKSFRKAIAGVHVLVAPHHGRQSGFHPELFNHFSPCITIVSDGRAGDTNAASRYSKVSRGWGVKRRKDGRTVQRKCVTTRNDGVIVARAWKEGSQPYLDVFID